MKKFYVFILLIIISVASYFLFFKRGLYGTVIGASNAANAFITPVTAKPETTASATSAFSSLLEPIYSSPVRLYSEDENIDVELISVSVDANGILETPSNWSIGGWYRKSSRAGEKGNIIINAHYDDNLGRPAAFWYLNKLEVGDTLYLVDNYGKLYSYVVTDIMYVGIDDPKRMDIVTNSDGSKSTLTLITCGGVWDVNKATYNQRVVVKADISTSKVGR